MLGQAPGWKQYGHKPELAAWTSWSPVPGRIRRARYSLQYLHPGGKKNRVRPLGRQAPNPRAAMRLSCTQQPRRERPGQSTRLSPATQALPLPSCRWQPTGELRCATAGSTGWPGPSALEHHPASSAAGSLQRHSPPRQLRFGGYSCFSSQRGSCAALQQPLSSAFACQRDFIPLRRGSEGHGGKDPQDRAAGTKQFKAASPQLAGSAGADVSQTPSWSQRRVARSAAAPTPYPSQPQLPHGRQELPGGWMLRCHLPPGLHKLSRGSCWQGARQAAVALMWVSAGHMPGPGQGVWLEAPGARLNYAGGEEISGSRLCHSSMRNLPRCPRRHCSPLCSRALSLWGSQAGMSPLQGNNRSSDFSMARRALDGSAPTSRQHQAPGHVVLDPEDALEAMQDQRWSSITHAGRR